MSAIDSVMHNVSELHVAPRALRLDVFLPLDCRCEGDAVVFALGFAGWFPVDAIVICVSALLSALVGAADCALF